MWKVQHTWIADRCSLWAVVLCGSGLCAPSNSAAQEHARTDAGEVVADVTSAWENIPSEGKALMFHRGAATVPRGGHWQGMQMQFDAARNRHLVYLSHDSESIAYLVIAEFPRDLSAPGRVIQLQTLPSDGQSPPLRHAGGIQLLGHTLVVGVEDNQQKTRSEVQFWNVADPAKMFQLKHLTIRRSGAPKDKTAGAVGIVQRQSDYLLAVANWDSLAVDFYTSSCASLADPQCRFESKLHWQVDAANKNAWHPDPIFGTYQAINLISDAHANLFLVGFDTSPSGRDFVDLFSIDMHREPNAVLQRVATKQINLQGGSHFRFSGGLLMDRDRMGILSSERDFGAEVHINIAK